MSSNLPDDIRELREDVVASIYWSWKRGAAGVKELAGALHTNEATVKYHIRRFEEEKRAKELTALADEATRQQKTAEQLLADRIFSENAEEWVGETTTIMDRDGHIVGGYTKPRKDSGIPDIIGTYGRR